MVLVDPLPPVRVYPLENDGDGPRITVELIVQELCAAIGTGQDVALHRAANNVVFKDVKSARVRSDGLIECVSKGGRVVFDPVDIWAIEVRAPKETGANEGFL